MLVDIFFECQWTHESWEFICIADPFVSKWDLFLHTQASKNTIAFTSGKSPMKHTLYLSVMQHCHCFCNSNYIFIYIYFILRWALPVESTGTLPGSVNLSLFKKKVFFWGLVYIKQYTHLKCSYPLQRLTGALRKVQNWCCEFSVFQNSLNSSDILFFFLWEIALNVLGRDK